MLSRPKRRSMSRKSNLLTNSKIIFSRIPKGLYLIQKFNLRSIVQEHLKIFKKSLVKWGINQPKEGGSICLNLIYRTRYIHKSLCLVKARRVYLRETVKKDHWPKSKHRVNRLLMYRGYRSFSSCLSSCSQGMKTLKMRE